MRLRKEYERNSGRQACGQGRIPPYALSCQLRQIDFLNIPVEAAKPDAIARLVLPPLSFGPI